MKSPKGLEETKNSSNLFFDLKQVEKDMVPSSDMYRSALTSSFCIQVIGLILSKIQAPTGPSKSTELFTLKENTE